MITAATDGVWANLKHSNDTPGPIKPIDCIIFRTRTIDKPDLIMKSAEAPATYPDRAITPQGMALNHAACFKLTLYTCRDNSQKQQLIADL